MMRRFLSIATALALSGCFSVESARTPPEMGAGAEQHVISSNYGWDLFACIPIVCGNDNDDSWCPFTFFKNEVRSDLVLAKVEKIAAEKGLEMRNVQIWTDRDIFFDCYYAPVPWVIQYHEANASAVLVRKGKK